MKDKKEKARKLSELTTFCSEALNVSRKYAYLWDEEGIWREHEYEDIWNKKNPALHITSGFIAQDESFNIYITRRDNEFVFKGRNFCYNHEGFGAEEAALTIKDYFGTYTHMSPKELRERFYSSLTEVLGKYMAKKELEKIKI
jgi:hypothetical protein